MSKRAQKAHRVLAVQKQLHRVAAWKLAELRGRLQELEASQAELIGALNEDDALHGLFIANIARRIRSLAEESSRVAREREDQSRKLIGQASRVRLVERMTARIDLQDARQEAQQELIEAIEHFLGRSSARLP